MSKDPKSSGQKKKAEADPLDKIVQRGFDKLMAGAEEAVKRKQ